MADPVVLALKADGPREEMRPVPAPRFFEFKQTELPNGLSMKPGDRFFVKVFGVVKAVNDEGGIMANILNVDGGPPQMIDPKPPMRVQTIGDVSPSP